MSARVLGEIIQGTVNGVPVEGWWTGRGVKITEIQDGKPLDPYWNIRGELKFGRVSEGWIMEVGAEYVLDG